MQDFDHIIWYTVQQWNCRYMIRMQKKKKLRRLEHLAMDIIAHNANLVNAVKDK